MLLPPQQWALLEQVAIANVNRSMNADVVAGRSGESEDAFFETVSEDC